LNELPVATSRAKRKAAIAFAIAVASAIFSALELHGWHIYVGLGLTAIATIYGLTHWKQKYSRP
jgi:hypothetical protein